MGQNGKFLVRQYDERDNAFEKGIQKNLAGIYVFCPDLQLVIGRAGDIAFKEEYMAKQRDNGIKISDWDTYLNDIRRKYSQPWSSIASHFPKQKPLTKQSW